MKKVLVAYTTNSGSTTEVAETIAGELSRQGTEVDVRRLEEVTDLEPYQAVLVGGPMILGWHRGAVNFVRQNRQALSQKKVAYFLTALRLTANGEDRVESVPVFADPSLAKPPKTAGRLGLKERYATVSNYLRPALKAAPEVKPVSAAIFGGRLELFRLNIFQMLFAVVVVQAQPGDYRNWDYIREWARGLEPIL